MTYSEWASLYFGENVSMPDAARDAWNASRRATLCEIAQYVEDKYDFLGDEITLADEIRNLEDELEWKK